MLLEFLGIGRGIMITMPELSEIITEQINYNKRKSLFYLPSDGGTILKPVTGLLYFLNQDSSYIYKSLKNILNDDKYNDFLLHISGLVIQQFMGVNQYLNFTKEDLKKLQILYDDLFNKVYRLSKNNQGFSNELNDLFLKHSSELKRFLISTNGKEIFRKYIESPRVLDIICAEYSPELQLNLLGITSDTILGPLLDIGCGPNVCSRSTARPAAPR